MRFCQTYRIVQYHMVGKYTCLLQFHEIFLKHVGMYQWSHLAILGWENSSTSGEAASGGILKFSMSHERHIPIPVQVTIFPHEWLSRRGEKKILHERRSREWRIFFLPQLLSHEWGKIVTRTGIGMCLEWRIGNFSRTKIAKWYHYHSY